MADGLAQYLHAPKAIFDAYTANKAEYQAKHGMTDP